MISGYLIGDRELLAKFDRAGPAIKAEVDATVLKLGYSLQLRVQRYYLRGPRPTRLGVVTGRLLRSITQGGADSRTRFESTATTATAYVGTNVEYGAAWEYGFTRRTGAGARGGGPHTMAAISRYFEKHPPGSKYYAARPFLAPALADMRQRITDELAAALKRGAEAAFK